MLYLTGLSIASFLCICISFKKSKRQPDYILQIWLGVIAVHLGLHDMQVSGFSYRYPHTLGMTLTMPLLHGVLLYFYTISWFWPERLTAGIVAKHLIPFTLLTALALPFFLLTADQKLAVFQRDGEGFEWYTLVQLPVIVLSGVAYTIVSFIEIRRGIAAGNVARIGRDTVRLLHYLIAGLAAIWILSAAFDDGVIFAGVVVFVLFFGLFSMSRVPGLYTSLAVTDYHAEQVSADSQPVLVERYVRTGLNRQEAARIMERVEELMKREKPYKNFDLALNDLAAALGTTANHLSQAINSVSGQTFYQYINHYRVREFLALAALEENKKYTFLALAYDCGFNSKTTFNKYFKVHTGLTPSEYFDKQAVTISGHAFA